MVYESYIKFSGQVIFLHSLENTYLFLKKHQANKVDLVSNSPVILWSDPDDCNRSFLFANHLGLDYG